MIPRRSFLHATVGAGALAALGDAAGVYAEEAARPRAALMPLIIDAVRARASVGEISDVLSARWGAYRPGV